jgi:hypothetical protein
MRGAMQDPVGASLTGLVVSGVVRLLVVVGLKEGLV